MFYSQQSEDKILYEKYLNYRDGFFIELGAMDGVTFSNSLFFENELNWRGILIEPTTQYNDLVKNRPNCINYNFAISTDEGQVEFLGNYALGGIIKTMSQKHRTIWNLDKNWSPILVKSIPIHKLISNNIKKVDFFSIDVEGGEFEVLSTYNWEIDTYVILIEMADDNIKNDNCRKLLLDKGFNFDGNIGFNEVWINRNYQHIKI